ncbi:MAG: hypothetical protein CBB68_05230 [Rhodospirillaceae bacterium TMED8]|nr:hypothetical protein [Magnetovibrio sp.]OUT51400.1 MAG: hypothetical protein CBB68_05230 [Rhodospirillaceae bacterium TMED8]|tara:strand:+ start:2899 stop:3270 length:372 start_codon:yes stop_codon:yes gene_type:complete
MILIFADIVLVIHFSIVVFITSGFFLIPIGYAANWHWTSNVKLRISHCGMMVVVTLETLLGITCPLTSLENILRGITQSDSFIGYWIQRLIYWDLPTHIFLILYCISLGWTLLMWRIFPPKRP